MTLPPNYLDADGRLLRRFVVADAADLHEAIESVICQR